jgi:TRAP-type C4-dicarboxylate transport system substrate-binding protein
LSSRVALGLALAFASSAFAEPAGARFTLRLATPAPEGTAWAREISAFARDVESTTSGAVKVKVVWGGIAGDDMQVAARVERGQLDGVMSGGMLCEEKAPTHRALRLIGVYRDYEETNWVAGQLRDSIEKESRDHGFVYLADVNIGAHSVFSRKPLRTLDEMRATKLWHWNLDEVSASMLKEMGFQLVELPLEKAGPAYQKGEHDGFMSIPGAMLAYQWAAHVHWVTDVRFTYLIACMMVANRAFDRLPAEHQQNVRLAAARFRARMNNMVVHEDAALLGGAFGKAGIKSVPVTSQLRAQVEEAAKAAREKLGEKLIPAALMRRVLELVAEYRQSHQRHADVTP